MLLLTFRTSWRVTKRPASGPRSGSTAFSGQCVSDLAGSFVFNHVRSFFRDNHGFLLPHEGEKPLKPYQKAFGANTLAL